MTTIDDWADNSHREFLLKWKRTEREERISIWMENEEALERWERSDKVKSNWSTLMWWEMESIDLNRKKIFSSFIFIFSKLIVVRLRKKWKVIVKRRLWKIKLDFARQVPMVNGLNVALKRFSFEQWSIDEFVSHQIRTAKAFFSIISLFNHNARLSSLNVDFSFSSSLTNLSKIRRATE